LETSLPLQEHKMTEQEMLDELAKIIIKYEDENNIIMSADLLIAYYPSDDSIDRYSFNGEKFVQPK